MRKFTSCVALALALVPAIGCSDSDDDVGSPGDAAFYRRADLVSGRAGAAVQVDPQLSIPRGLAFGPGTLFWVANEGSSAATVYDEDGVPQSDAFVLPPSSDGAATDGPTGVVVNESDGFLIGSGAGARPAQLVLATRGGALIAWSPDVDAGQAVIAVDRASTGASYTGLAIATNGARTRLYAADFLGGKIDVFDESFEPASGLAAFAFEDPRLPEDYAPYGIQEIEGRIYVAYARRSQDGDRPRTGLGNGYVNVFDAEGGNVTRFASTGLLDAPWGMARAPEDFGRFGGALLVGNSGNGRITAFDFSQHQILGQLESRAGERIVIEGLSALQRGNGRMAGERGHLYFTAGGRGMHGTFGVIQPVPTERRAQDDRSQQTGDGSQPTIDGSESGGTSILPQ